MRKGGLLELCHKPTEVRPLSIRLSVFTLVLALVEGRHTARQVEQGGQGGGNSGEQGVGEGSI